MIAAFLCMVVAMPHDGDTLTCKDGTRIRIAGVNAREISGDPCPRNRPCPAMSARGSREVLASLVLGKTLECTQVGTSYKRVVASCSVRRRDLRCSLLAAGAVARWRRYEVAYGLGRCGT